MYATGYLTTSRAGTRVCVTATPCVFTHKGPHSFPVKVPQPPDLHVCPARFCRTSAAGQSRALQCVPQRPRQERIAPISRVVHLAGKDDSAPDFEPKPATRPARPDRVAARSVVNQD